MATKKERVCLCCGSKYRYCPRCGEDKNKPAWMFNFDKEECKDIFQLLTDYNAGDLSVEDAYKSFKMTGVDPTTIVNKSIYRQLQDLIMKVNPKVSPEKAETKLKASKKNVKKEADSEQE